MENIPVPPYPGPPLETSGSVQQRAFSHQPAPQTHLSTAQAQSYNHQGSPGPQHHRSLPMENIPVPPYPGPPLESQSTSSVQQRTFTHQPAPQTHHTTAEVGPCNNQQSYGPQHHRSLPMENIPLPPYPGPPLETQSSSSVQQPAPQTHHTTAGGAHLYSNGSQPHSSLPMENIPVPPYPGPPLDSQSPSFVQNRTFTHQPSTLTNHIPSQGGTWPHLHLPYPQPQCSLPTENVPVPLYPGPPLGFDSTSSLKQRTHQPAPHTSVEGAHLSVGATYERSAEMPSEKAFSMEKMSASLKHSVSLENNVFTHVHLPQVESHCSSEKTTIVTSEQTTTHIKLSTDSVSSASYSGGALNLQLPNQTVQQIRPDTPAYMYPVYGNGVVQPGVQVVQAGGTQYVIQPQRQAVVIPSMAGQTIVQPAPAQPTVVIQPSAPAVRVIQPQVLPAVIQPNAVVYRRYY